MFPEPNHQPAGGMEGLVVEAVTFMGAPELRNPVVGVGHRDGTVLWASMPKAPIEVHHDLAAGKDDVGGSAAVGQPNEQRLAEAQTLGVEGGPEPHLGSRVGGAVAPHCRRGGRAGGGRSPTRGSHADRYTQGRTTWSSPLRLTIGE